MSHLIALDIQVLRIVRVAVVGGGNDTGNVKSHIFQSFNLVGIVRDEVKSRDVEF